MQLGLNRIFVCEGRSTSLVTGVSIGFQDRSPAVEGLKALEEYYFFGHDYDKEMQQAKQQCSAV